MLIEFIAAPKSTLYILKKGKMDNGRRFCLLKFIGNIKILNFLADRTEKDEGIIEI